MKNEDHDPEWADDPRAAPDEFESRLERTLSTARFDAGRRPLHIPAESSRASLRTRILAVAAIAAAIIALTWAAVQRLPDSTSRSRQPPIEMISSSGEVAWSPAKRLACAAGGSARLRIGTIGTVELAEDSSLKLVDGGDDGYRVFLERGTLTASIFAAPRLFAVGTPSGLAVDLGCVYRTHVEDDGSALIEVVSGRVSFEADDVHALVPAGAQCRAWPGRGPGLPRWSDASPALCAAIERVENANEARERTDAIAALITAGEKRDSLTLFHLLERARDGERERIVARLETWNAIPATVERTRLIAGDAEALLALRESLRESW